MNSVSGVHKASLALFGVLLGALPVSAFGSGPAGATTPVISSFTPLSGPDGTTVKITGSSFPGPFPGSCAAEFSNDVTTSACHIKSATGVNVIVPSGAASGPIAISQGSMWTATSSTSFTVEQSLVSLTPNSGPVGTKVTVTGSSFPQPYPAACTATFNETPTSTCTIHSATKAVATVPADATSGFVTLGEPGWNASSSSAFVVSPSVSLSATAGPPGTTLSVSGNAFGANEQVDLSVGTTDEAVASTNANGDFAYIGLTIPSSAQPGTVDITATGRQSGLQAEAPFLVRSNWPQQGFGPTHRGFNPYENTLNAGNVGSMATDWTFATGALVESSPTVANGTAYVGSDDDNVYALNATTGAKVWTFATGSSVTSSPAVANGVVYVGSYDDDVYALNATTGAKVWRFATGSPVTSSPTVVNGVVYVSSTDDDVYALDATTGTKIWSFATGASITSSPAVANGMVYFGSYDDNVYALNASTGAKVWSFTAGSYVSSSPAVADGIVYVGSFDHDLYALNAATGAELWSFTAGAVVGSEPAVADGMVYIGSYDDNLYALNAATGAEVWSFTTGGSVASSPAVANGVVYTTSDDGAFYALNAATGAQLWSDAASTFTDNLSSPAVVNGIVYVGSGDDSVYAFHLVGS